MMDFSLALPNLQQHSQTKQNPFQSGGVNFSPLIRKLICVFFDNNAAFVFVTI